MTTNRNTTRNKQRTSGSATATLTRRGFLGAAGGVVATSTFGSRFAFASPGQPTDGDVLVLVFLRGGADGLSIVAPNSMESYHALRPTIRVKHHSEVADPALAGLTLTAGGAVNPFALDNVFALHPSMSALHNTAWSDGNLGIVHAVGMPASESDTRSHFDSMTNWESGSAHPDDSGGFLNRFLTSIGVDGHGEIAGIGRGGSLQRSLSGPVPTFSMGSISTFGVSGFAQNSWASEALGDWYNGPSADIVRGTGKETLEAVAQVASVNWSNPSLGVANGASYPSGGFASSLREVAALMRANVGLRVACIDAGGWDTHSDSGEPENPNSYFSRRCAELSNGLAAFYTDLGSQMSEVTVATISEFGRTINENGTGGTDHGRGSAMLVMGGGVNGGVHGPFVDEISDGPEGDLAVLTDYRTVLSEVATVRGGAPTAASVFPSWDSVPYLGVCSA